MAERGFFLIGGVIAPGAGIIGIPADGRTGGRLCVMVHRVMAERGFFLIGGVIAPGAGVVGVPADSRAGGGLGVVMDEVVAQRFPVFLSADFTLRLLRTGSRAAGVLGERAVFMTALFAYGLLCTGSRAAGMVLPAKEPVAVIAVDLMLLFRFILVPEFMI